jgi:hypothetical protein
MTRTARLVIVAVALQILTWPVATATARDKLAANVMVKAVSATSLTATAGGKETTFNIDSKTRVIGKGVGTRSAAKGGKATAADLIDEGDRVTVRYAESGSSLLATRIDVVARSAKK